MSGTTGGYRFIGLGRVKFICKSTLNSLKPWHMHASFFATRMHACQGKGRAGTTTLCIHRVVFVYRRGNKQAFLLGPSGLIPLCLSTSEGIDRHKASPPSSSYGQHNAPIIHTIEKLQQGGNHLREMGGIRWFS